MVWSALDVSWPGVLGSVLGRRSGIARAALDQNAPRSGVPETQYGGRWPAILSKTVDCVGFWRFMYIHVQFLPAEGLEMDSTQSVLDRPCLSRVSFGGIISFEAFWFRMYIQDSIPGCQPRLHGGQPRLPTTVANHGCQPWLPTTVAHPESSIWVKNQLEHYLVPVFLAPEMLSEVIMLTKIACIKRSVAVGFPKCITCLRK